MVLGSKVFYLLLFLSVGAQNAYAEDVKFIEVFGQASVTPLKTKQKLTVTLLEQGISIAKTLHRVNTKRESVIKALNNQHIKQAALFISDIELLTRSKKIGVDIDKIYLPTKNDIFVAADVSMQSDTQHISKHNKYDTQQLTKNKEHFYSVSQVIKCEVEDLNSFSKLLDKLIKLGVEDINLTTSEKNESEQYNKALNLAITNGKNKADDLAIALNVKLEQVLEVQEIRPNVHRSLNAADLLQNGTEDKLNQAISAQVRISFAISSQ